MESNERTTAQPSSEKQKLAEEVKEFYQGELKDIFLTFFRNPIDGILNIFQKPSEKAYKNSLILFASTFVLYFAGSYFLAGEARKYIEFSTFIKIGLIPIVMMLLISIIAFFIKSVSGNPDFKNELQTGGLCAIPISLLLFMAFVIKLFSNTDIISLVNNLANAGTIALLFVLYILLMFINVFQQSLKASSTEDAISWYLAPASVLLAGYLTFQVSKMLF